MPFSSETAKKAALKSANVRREKRERGEPPETSVIVKIPKKAIRSRKIHPRVKIVAIEDILAKHNLCLVTERIKLISQIDTSNLEGIKAKDAILADLMRYVHSTRKPLENSGGEKTPPVSVQFILPGVNSNPIVDITPPDNHKTDDD